MIDLITTILMISILGSVALYLYYVLIFTLIKQFGTPWWVIALGIGFLVFDTLVNLVIVTVIYIEWPKLHKHEWLVTQRFLRWRKEWGHRPLNDLSKTQRFRLLSAKFICDRMLDRFDPFGDHC